MNKEEEGLSEVNILERKSWCCYTYITSCVICVYKRRLSSLAEDDFLKVLHAVLLLVVGKHIEYFLTGLGLEVTVVVEALTADATGQIEILLHHGHS